MAPERTDFATLKRPGTPNTYLIAPEGLCRQAKIDAVAPVFDVPAVRLRQELLSIVIAEPRSSHTLADEQALYDDFVVRSAVFRFPDLISVKFLDAKGGKSTLVLYSRSVYGRWDLGVNRMRAQGWLKQLAAAVKPVKA
jgi:uncharacterized protein (DUF1499 family)